MSLVLYAVGKCLDSQVSCRILSGNQMEFARSAWASPASRTMLFTGNICLPSDEGIIHVTFDRKTSSSYWLFRHIQDISFATVFFHSFRSQSFSVSSSTVLFIGSRSLFICQIHVCFGLPQLPLAFFNCSLKASFHFFISSCIR